MFYVYVLYSPKIDKFYTGFTNDLKRRVSEHKSDKTQTTSRMADFMLVYYEASNNKEDAQSREKQLKTGFGRGYLRKRLKIFLDQNKNMLG